MIVMAFLFLTVLLVGVPVFIALAGSSFVYTHFIAELPDFVILHRMAGGIDSFPLLAVPFFILAGNLMNSAGITNRIYDFAVALAGWTRGGLAHVNIIGSVIFAGMSGTAIADAAACSCSACNRASASFPEGAPPAIAGSAWAPDGNSDRVWRRKAMTPAAIRPARRRIPHQVRRACVPPQRIKSR